MSYQKTERLEKQLRKCLVWEKDEMDGIYAVSPPYLLHLETVYGRFDTAAL